MADDAPPAVEETVAPTHQRKATLDKFLTERPEKNDLIEHNILKEGEAHPKLQAAQDQLRRSRVSDAVSRKLTDRPERDELVESNILHNEEDPTSAEIGEKLQKKLENRPEASELVDVNILKEASGTTHPTLQAAKDQLQKAQTRDDLQKKLNDRPQPEAVEKILNSKPEFEAAAAKKTELHSGTNLSTVQGNIQDQWAQVQKKTFTKWINSRFFPASLVVENLDEDLKDGVKLVALLENLSRESLGRYIKKPNLDIQKAENVNKALAYIKSKDVKLVNISAEDIIHGNVKLTMGLIWTIILRFVITDISVGELTAKEGLLLWCQRKTAGYDNVNIENFTSSFQNGLAFNALIHAHRPGLIDYENMSAADRVGNLNNAFDVAEGQLGIPKLLDVEDFAVRPDERSVMTYVAEYFHYFSKQQTSDLAGKRIVNVMKLTESNDAMKHDYAERAQAMKSWLESKAKAYDGSSLGNSVDEVNANIQELHKYKMSERHRQLIEQRTLEKLMHSLTLKLRADNRPAYCPPAGLSLAELNGQWQNLGAVERTYAESLRKQLLHWRQYDAKVKRAELLGVQVESFVAENKHYVEDRSLGETPGDIQRKLKVHEAFEVEFDACAQRLGNISKLAGEVEASGHGKSAELQVRAAELKNTMNNAKIAVDERKHHLNEALASLQKIENMAVDYARKAQVLTLWVDNAEETLTAPILSDSVAEADKLQADLGAFLAEAEGKREELSACVNLANDIRTLGGTETTFTQLSVDVMRAKSNHLSKLMEQRRDDVAAEVADQGVAAEATIAYTAKANALASWVQGKKAALDGLSGDEAKQLADLKRLKDDLSSQKKTISELEALAAKAPHHLPAEGLAFEALAGRYEDLEHDFKEREKNLDYQSQKKKQTGVPEEQLRDIKTCFDHFDKDGSGELSSDEFKACLRSLGQDVTDDEVQALFSKVDADGDKRISFDEFTSFMVKRIRQTDTKEDLLAAFDEVAQGRGFLTEEDLRNGGFLDEHYTQYLLTNMPKVAGQDNQYDYKTFADQIFAR